MPGKGDVRPCVAVLSPIRCSLLLLVRPAEEMCGEEAAPPTVRRREVSGEEDATGGEMCLVEGVKRWGVEWRGQGEERRPEQRAGVERERSLEGSGDGEDKDGR